jgi:DNA-binding transcriptional LysR family regulator
MDDLRRVRHFVGIVDAGTVAAAAEQAHLSQPSMSRQIRLLERELRLDLFNRDGHRLSLTAAGHRFLPVARDLIARADSASAAARVISEGNVPTLVISAPRTTVTDLLAPFLAGLGEADPLVDVSESDPDEVFTEIFGRTDLGVSIGPPPANLASRLIAELPIWANVRAADPWRSHQTISLEELVSRPLCLLPAHFAQRRILDDACARAGLQLSEVLEASTGELAQALAASGRGPAVVSDDPRFDCHPIRIVGTEGLLRLRLYAGWDPNHHARDGIADLVERITQYCLERYGSVLG